MFSEVQFEKLIEAISRGQLQRIEVIKQKDEHDVSIEVSNANSKFEKQVTVKIRGDFGQLDELVKFAQQKYNELLKEGTT